MVGALVGAIILLEFVPQETPQSYADMRRSLAILGDYMLLPSLGLVLVSGVLAIAATPAYINKGWALAKAFFGIIMFKGGLHVVGAHSHYADQLASRLEAGEVIPATDLAGALPYEDLLLWTMLVLSVANIVLAIWRPRFSRKESRQTRDAVTT